VLKRDVRCELPIDRITKQSSFGHVVCKVLCCNTYLTRFLPILAVVLWPFIYFYRFVIPNHSFSLQTGNDFVPIYYKSKVYLLAWLAQGHFPLWSPSEGSGFPFYSNPFAQAFYPLNLPLVLFYRVLDGYSVSDHQIFTILGLSIFALGLYLWLSELVSSKRAVLLAVLLISVCFKLAEIIRFPNAIHTAAWMPWLMYGVTLAIWKERRPWAAVVLFISGIMILTAGYPYYAYYCLFLVPPYICLLLVPRTRMLVSSKEMPSIVAYRNALSWILAPLLGAALVCAPYLWHIKLLMDRVTDRAGGDYSFSTSHLFGFIDTIGSLLFPPAANYEGWYYFSMLGFFLIVLFVAGCFLEKKTRRQERNFVVLMLVWFLVISYISYGKQSYLFSFLWQYMPGFSSLRVWGRFSIVLLPIIALLIARSYEYLEFLLLDGHRSGERGPVLEKLLSVLVFTSLVVVVAQVFMIQFSVFTARWTISFRHFLGKEYWFVAATVLTTVTLGGVMFWSLRRGLSSPRLLALFFVILFASAVADLRPLGAIQRAKPADSNTSRRLQVDVGKNMYLSFSTPRRNQLGYVSLTPIFSVGLGGNWFFHDYVVFHQRVFSGIRSGPVINPKELIPFRELMGMDNAQRFFLSKSLDHKSIKSFVQDALSTQQKLQPKVIVKEYNGDRLRVVALLPKAAYFSFIDNWSPGWRAMVNGSEVEMKKLFGTFKSLHLPKGKSRVLFEYCPFSRDLPFLIN
jgi:hypothetical protein